MSEKGMPALLLGDTGDGSAAEQPIRIAGAGTYGVEASGSDTGRGDILPVVSGPAVNPGQFAGSLRPDPLTPAAPPASSTAPSTPIRLAGTPSASPSPSPLAPSLPPPSGTSASRSHARTLPGSRLGHPHHPGHGAIVPGLGRVHEGHVGAVTGLVHGFGGHVLRHFPKGHRARIVEPHVHEGPIWHGPDLMIAAHAHGRYEFVAANPQNKVDHDRQRWSRLDPGHEIRIPGAWPEVPEAGETFATLSTARPMTEAGERMTRRDLERHDKTLLSQLDHRPAHRGVGDIEAGAAIGMAQETALEQLLVQLDRRFPFRGKGPLDGITTGVNVIADWTRTRYLAITARPSQVANTAVWNLGGLDRPPSGETGERCG